MSVPMPTRRPSFLLAIPLRRATASERLGRRAQSPKSPSSPPCGACASPQRAYACAPDPILSPSWRRTKRELAADYVWVWMWVGCGRESWRNEGRGGDRGCGLEGGDTGYEAGAERRTEEVD
ncbi:hypothetical protein B0H13DRAFT_2354596 [Mycena leptocephala]|nr:hypothetical protein B0H13DRAFT_2354596 [Mycena leptocephala]